MRRWLGWFALAMIIGLQAEALLRPFSSVQGVRILDWAVLLTPYAILGSAAVVLLRAGADREHWVVLGVGGITFATGFGLHLAANTISGIHAAQPPATIAGAGDLAAIIHMWDEVVSHYLGYTGLFLVMAAMAMSLRGRDLEVGPLDHLVAALVGVTLFNGYIEGGTPYLGVLFMLVAVMAARRWRPAAVSRLILPVAGVVLGMLLVWGLYWLLAEGRAFPQFSELGWI